MGKLCLIEKSRHASAPIFLGHTVNRRTQAQAWNRLSPCAILHTRLDSYTIVHLGTLLDLNLVAEMLETLPHSPDQNHLLAALPEVVQERVYPFLELTPMPLGRVLYESGVATRHVYFPTDAIISLLYVMENGASAEIAVVGNEGLVGLALFMGGESTTGRTIVQSAGFAYRLPGKRFKDEVNRHGELLMLMLRYTQSLITQMAQTAVCNRHHSIDQQLCRWLLLSLDRLSGDHLIMTQELIANMLGVRREGVTEAAGRLQKQGVIEYNRGHIRVLNRPKLEELTCECYKVVKRETDRLLPLFLSKNS